MCLRRKQFHGCGNGEKVVFSSRKQMHFLKVEVNEFGNCFRKVCSPRDYFTLMPPSKRAEEKRLRNALKKVKRKSFPAAVFLFLFV